MFADLPRANTDKRVLRARTQPPELSWVERCTGFDPIAIYHTAPCFLFFQLTVHRLLPHNADPNPLSSTHNFNPHYTHHTTPFFAPPSPLLRPFFARSVNSLLQPTGAKKATVNGKSRARPAVLATPPPPSPRAYAHFPSLCLHDVLWSGI